MKVVLDTNILVRKRYRFDGPHMSILTRLIAIGRAELVVPELVILETVNKYKEELTKAMRTAAGASADVSELLGGAKIKIEPVAIAEEVARFETGLRVDLARLNAACPGFSDISHALILGRDLERRRPFQVSGSGYRDALLWETLLKSVIDGDCVTYLVTTNTKDFGTSNAPIQLHPDLKRDLEHLKHVDAKVQLFASFDEFVDSELKPLVPSNPPVIEAICEGKYRSFKFYDFFSREREGIQRELERHFGNLDMCLNWPAIDDPTVAYVEDPVQADILEAYELDETRLFLAYDVTADVSVDFFIDKYELYDIGRDSMIDIRDRDWSEHSAWANANVRLPFRISMVLSLNAMADVESYEVEFLEFFGHCWKCGVPIRSDSAENCPVCRADLLRRGPRGG